MDWITYVPEFDGNRDKPGRKTDHSGYKTADGAGGKESFRQCGGENVKRICQNKPGGDIASEAWKITRGI